MKPYGRKQHHHNLPDNHINVKLKRQGYVNWWEVEIEGCKSRKRERQLGKKEILNQIIESCQSGLS